MQKSFTTLIVFATLFLCLTFISPSVPTAKIPNAHASSPTISLTGRVSNGWNGTNPGPTIPVTQGDLVSINLVSGDGFPHTFVIDVAHAGITPSPNCNTDKCSGRFPPSTTFTFTADMAPGTYTYYCSIHLTMMYGSIIVESASNGSPDFTATSNPTTLAITQGSTGSATITVASQNGFSGPVTLSATVSPNGPVASLSSSTVTVPPNGSTSSTLTISTGSAGLYSTPVARGSYAITVSEMSGSVSHTTQIQLTVGSSSSGSTSSIPGSMYSTNGPYNASVLIGAIALIAILAVTTAVVLVRRRK